MTVSSSDAISALTPNRMKLESAPSPGGQQPAADLWCRDGAEPTDAERPAQCGAPQLVGVVRRDRGDDQALGAVRADTGQHKDHVDDRDRGIGQQRQQCKSRDQGGDDAGGDGAEAHAAPRGDEGSGDGAKVECQREGQGAAEVGAFALHEFG